MKISTCLIILLLGVSLSFGPVAAAGSAPTKPQNTFNGYVKINGEVAPAETVINAYIDSVRVGTATVMEEGRYCSFGIKGVEEDDGKIITFRLANFEAEQHPSFNYDDSTPRELDLTFSGEYDGVAPVLSNPRASPNSILNDGVDASNISVLATDEASAIKSVILDLSPLGSSRVSMEPSDDLYVYSVNSTQAGNFSFNIIATDFAGNENSTTVSLTVETVDDTINDYGEDYQIAQSGAEEAVEDYFNNQISKSQTTKILEIYFGDGWDLI